MYFLLKLQKCDKRAMRISRSTSNFDFFGLICYIYPKKIESLQTIFKTYEWNSPHEGGREYKKKGQGKINLRREYYKSKEKSRVWSANLRGEFRPRK